MISTTPAPPNPHLRYFCADWRIEALNEEKIDLFVTLPEEPTASLMQAVQADPYFQCVTVASEDGGVALTAGAAIAGRRAVFVTGIAGQFYSCSESGRRLG
jgi:sulfopyruvate decarboxylase TPP-binding subunit